MPFRDSVSKSAPIPRGGLFKTGLPIPQAEGECSRLSSQCRGTWLGDAMVHKKGQKCAQFCFCSSQYLQETQSAYYEIEAGSERVFAIGIVQICTVREGR